MSVINESLPGPFQKAPLKHSDLVEQTPDDHHPQLHTIASHNDTTATGTELNELINGSETTLHNHPACSTSDSLVVSWSEGSSQPYIIVNNQVWTRVASFVFSGTDLYGVPSSIDITGWITKKNKDFDVRIVDITNNCTIVATKLNINNESEAVIDMGTLSNLATGKVIWEVQGRKGSGIGALASLIVNF